MQDDHAQNFNVRFMFFTYTLTLINWPSSPKPIYKSRSVSLKKFKIEQMFVFKWTYNCATMQKHSYVASVWYYVCLTTCFSGICFTFDCRKQVNVIVCRISFVFVCWRFWQQNFSFASENSQVLYIFWSCHLVINIMCYKKISWMLLLTNLTKRDHPRWNRNRAKCCHYNNSNGILLRTHGPYHRHKSTKSICYTSAHITETVFAHDQHWDEQSCLSSPQL